MNRRLVPLLAFVLVSSAHAILPGTTTAAWPWAGKLGGVTAFNATAVAVQDHWILTAAHTVVGYAQSEVRFQLDGGPILNSVAIVRHPTDDLALINVSASFPGWYDIYWAGDQIGKIGTLVGYGTTGTWNGSAWVYNAYPATYGTKREGTNKVLGSQYVDFGNLRGTFLIYDFDSATLDFGGDGFATPNECTLGGGDSGGPTFLQDVGGAWKVAGIHSWVGQFTGGPPRPQYGSALGDLRLTSYKAWIESIVPAEVLATTVTPSPGSIISGVIGDLARPDDARVAFRPGPVGLASQFPLQVVYEGTSPVSTTTGMRICVESHASNGNVSQVIELFNFVTPGYVQLDSRTLGIVDGLVELNVATPSEFIGPGNVVRARIRCKPNGAIAIFPWQARYDRVVWNINR